MGKRFLLLWVNSLRQSWPAYLAVVVLVATGIAAGSLSVQRLQADQAQELSIYLDQFMAQAGVIEVDSVKALQDVLYSDITVILAVYLLGLTVIGIPVILGIIFTHGFVLGYTVCFLAMEKSIQGIILACAAVLPQNIILVPALIMAGVASLSFAVLLARRFNNSKVVIWPNFVAYSGLILIVLVFSAVAGLVEVYFTPLLVKLAANYML